MEQSEVYFRGLDTLTARENFLEKEMLDADVHHLEVRTGFFDKLAVLAAGSLAVGISFIVSGYQRDSLQHVIHQHLCCLSVALVLILFSLLLCLIHNYLISRAVFLLSDQLESVYKAAHELTAWTVENPNARLLPSTPAFGVIASHEAESNRLRKQKAAVIRGTIQVGMWAVGLLIAGYAVGLASVVSIIAHAN